MKRWGRRLEDRFWAGFSAVHHNFDLEKRVNVLVRSGGITRVQLQWFLFILLFPNYLGICLPFIDNDSQLQKKCTDTGLRL